MTTTGLTPIPDDLHAHHLLLLASGERLARVVHVLAELGVAELLADRPRTVSDLAALTSTHPPSLYRLLRCAAAVGIFVELPRQAFTLTALGDGLRSRYPDTVLPLLRYSNLDIVRRPFDNLLYSTRTGEPAFRSTFGMEFYEYLEQNPEVSSFFARFMQGWSQQIVDEELAGFDLGRFDCVADLGGGDGFFLAQILKRNPTMKGYLLDLPAVVSQAYPLLAEHGVEDRATVVAGDFFVDPLPLGCDAYLLKAVLHNWSDSRAVELLRRVRGAIGDGGARLLVVEPVIGPANRWDYGKFLDIDMLVIFGGRERTLEEWRGLLADSGFELLNEPDQHWSLLECRPTAVPAR